MSTDKAGVYQRGGFWLDYDRAAGGLPTSDRWYIYWYDPATGHQRRKSTRTPDVRLACDRLDEHYLAVHRPTAPEQAIYSLPEAMTDYWIEHGRHQASAGSIKARLKLFSRFLDIEAEAGRLTDPFLPEHLDDRMLERFRTWAIADPIVARRKDKDGNWIDGKSRKRAASTAEESVIQVKAALNHAFGSRRLRYVPPLKHKTRDQVTSARTYRLSVDAIAELLDYSIRGGGKYSGHPDRLIPLRRYLIGAICTLARPDAVLDMSVAPEREQWMQHERRFALNPAGRLQTKKVRPVMPVVELLQRWLGATDEWLVCRERRSFDDDKQIDVVAQLRVGSVRSGWDTARAQLGIPDGWGPKLIRHSMATILANRRVDLIELEMSLGHRPLGKTSSRYAIFDPDYLSTIRDGIEDVVADLTRKAGAALYPSCTRVSPDFQTTSRCSEREPQSQEIEYKRGKWWARQGLNLRPLRCQHSALPLSYAPTAGPLAGPGGLCKPPDYNPVAVPTWNMRSTSRTRSRRWNGFDNILACGGVAPFFRATAAKPVMNMIRI